MLFDCAIPGKFRDSIQIAVGPELKIPECSFAGTPRKSSILAVSHHMLYLVHFMPKALVCRITGRQMCSLQILIRSMFMNLNVSRVTLETLVSNTQRPF